MANIPVNSGAFSISGSGAITGSFAGFTVPSSVVFSALKDANNTVIATPTTPLAFSANSFVHLTVTSASISSGAVIFYYN
jgi:hypothetical protein